MTAGIEFISSGSLTSPRGFCAGAAAAGIKKNKDSLDLAILFSETPCVAAGLFTTNRIKAAPVLLSQRRILSGSAQAVVANSGCANAGNGEDGLSDAMEMADQAAQDLGIPEESVLVASTGVIGDRLPMAKIKAGMKKIVLSRDGGQDFTRAIMTTDTVPKETAVAVTANGTGFTIGGAAKGSGMIHPNLATLLCFLTTDAAVELDFLQSALRRAIDLSLNMVSVDGDTSTNDTVLILANGQAGNETISAGSPLAAAFQTGLEKVCVYLARNIARDGEGATKLIEVTVAGAASPEDARKAARTIVSSPLVKTAVYGNDPNWGRVLMALGRSETEVEESKLDLFLGGVSVIKAGKQAPARRDELVRAFDREEVTIMVNLNLGQGRATAWGCDLTEEYVRINSQYTT